MGSPGWYLPRQTVNSIESGGLITFGQRWEVKHSLDEVIHCAIQGHDRLPDMDQLGRALADDMYAQYRPVFAMKDELEASGGVAANLAARDLPVVGHAYFIWNVLIGELLFRLADKRDLRDGVNAIRIDTGVGVDRFIVEHTRD